MYNWFDQLWPWNLFVLTSAVIAWVCWSITKRLRLHSIAVLFGAGLWFLYCLVLVPCFVSSTTPTSFDDNTTGIALTVSIGCCAFNLGGFHSLLCLALALEIIRTVFSRKEGGSEGRRDRTGAG